MRIARTFAMLLLAGGAVAGTFAGLEGVGLAARHANGKPSVKAGEPQAIWIWYDNTGWHLRGSTGKVKHTFTGYLRARGGMANPKPTRSGIMKSFEITSDGVRFEFEIGGTAPGSIEGFDWQQSGDDCVNAELKIDGKPQPARVFVGLRSESPEMFPFLSCRG